MTAISALSNQIFRQTPSETYRFTPAHLYKRQVAAKNLTIIFEDVREPAIEAKLMLSIRKLKTREVPPNRQTKTAIPDGQMTPFFFLAGFLSPLADCLQCNRADLLR